MKKIILWIITIIMVLLGILWIVKFVYQTGKVLPQLIGVILLVLVVIGIVTVIKSIKDRK